MDPTGNETGKRGCNVNSGNEMELGNFADYLLWKQLTPERSAPFYVKWVREFLQRAVDPNCPSTTGSWHSGFAEYPPLRTTFCPAFIGGCPWPDECRGSSVEGRMLRIGCQSLVLSPWLSVVACLLSVVHRRSYGVQAGRGATGAKNICRNMLSHR